MDVSTGVSMDEQDRAILNAIQSDFPVSSTPFFDIGQDLGLSEEDVMKRVRRLKEVGIIRRIGANISPEKMKYVSTLCAAKVPAEKMSLFAEAVNAYAGVTHNYVRDNPYNVWFTFIAPSREHIDTALQQIEEKTGVSGILDLPATHVFKIRAQFNL